MKPQHHRLSSADPSHSPSRRRRNIRLQVFLVGHVAAVVLLYAAALHLGGGPAPAPFPPDGPAAASRARLPAPPLAPADFTPAAQPPDTFAHAPARTRQAWVLPTAAPDVAPPWAASPSPAPGQD